MLKLSVCTETVYCHEDFNNRIEKISKIGINTIEFWQWSNKDLKGGNPSFCVNLKFGSKMII